jgi:hypothetical protein
MSVASNIANIARSEGDPKVLSTGPSSLPAVDRLGRALGWFSLGLGLMEMVAPRTVTRALGMEGHEGLVRAYGAREIGAGVLSLSTERSVGLWSRVAGDALDIGTVVAVAGGNERKRGAVGLTLALLAGVAVIDLLAAQAVTAKHSRGAGSPRSYRDRTGYPQGLDAARRAARQAHASADRRLGDAPCGEVTAAG